MLRPMLRAGVLAGLALAAAWSPARALDADDVARRAEEAARAANPRRPKAVVLETRPVGRTYLSQVDVKIEGRASREDWGFLGGGGHVTFGGTLAYRGTVLANDGETIIEERTYQTLSAALVVTVDRVRFPFLNPRLAREALLGALAMAEPRAAAPVAKGLDWLLGEAGVTLTDKDIVFGEKVVLDRRDRNLFAALRLDRIMGKTFRITYANDGTGIRQVVPVNTDMTADEEKIIRSGCYLFDAAFLDSGARRAGERWTVPAAVFGNLLAGLVVGQPEGALHFQRRPDETRNDATGAPRRHAVLALDPVRSDDVTLRQEARRSDKLTWEESATLRGLKGAAYVLAVPADEGTGQKAETYIASLEAEGLAELKALSKDHLLFQARFETAPTMTIRYFSFPAAAPAP